MQGLVRIPDLSFVSWDHLPERRLPEEALPDLTPDLAVEILSAGNTPGEMDHKLHDYFFSGTRLVWYIDPQRRNVRVYSSPDQCVELSERQTLDGGAVLPDFSLPLPQLFARLPNPKGRAEEEALTRNGSLPLKFKSGGSPMWLRMRLPLLGLATSLPLIAWLLADAEPPPGNLW